MADNNNDTKRSDGAEAYKAPTKSAFPWWLPLLLLLVAIPIGYLLFGNRDKTPTTTSTTPASITAPADAPKTDAAAPAPKTDAGAAPTDTTKTDMAAPDAKAGDKKVYSGKDITTGTTAAASTKGEPLSNVVDLVSAKDKTAFLGRKVKFTDVKVAQVLTDRAFFIGTSDQERMLVLLDKGMDAGPNGQRVAIQNGGTVSLTGIVETMPKQEILNQQYQLTGKDYDAVAKEPTYLHATVAQKK